MKKNCNAMKHELLGYPTSVVERVGDKFISVRERLIFCVRPEKFQFLGKWKNRNFGYEIVISVKNP